MGEALRFPPSCPPADEKHAHLKRAAAARGREAVGHSPARQSLQVGGGRGASRFCAAACARILGPAVSARESPESEGTRSEHSRALVLVPMATFVGVARIYERSVSQVRSVHGVARYVGRARGWCGRLEQCVGAGTEGCGLHARSSAARISVQSVQMNSETSASCKSWPHPFIRSDAPRARWHGRRLDRPQTTWTWPWAHRYMLNG